MTLDPAADAPRTGDAELTHHGIGSRFGAKSADLKHQWLDPIIVGAPWVLGGAAA